MSPFDDAPAVVVATADDLEHFILVLPDVATPQVSLRIEMDAPRIAKTIGPQFGTRLSDIQKGIVFGNRILLSRCGMLDVDPQHSRNQIGDLLTREVRVRIGCAVAG